MGRKHTTLSRSIDIISEKEQYDAACKKVLAEKIILAWIMKHIVKEYADCEVEEIAEKYIEGIPKISEIHYLPDETNTPKIRGIYYCSRMISSQYGTTFTESHYEKIQKVYSIWICMSPPKYRSNTINMYSVKEDCIVGNIKEKEKFYDLLTAIIICLGDYDEDAGNDLLKVLDVLLSTDTRPVEKKRILESEFGISMTKEMEGEMEHMCNLSDGVERKGIEKGIKIGIEQGIERNQRAVVINMLRRNMSIEDICACVGCDETYIEKIKAQDV